ncbi:hypothetical protein HK102_005284, partial [Quaeritorhiza haematococci]
MNGQPNTSETSGGGGGGGGGAGWSYVGDNNRYKYNSAGSLENFKDMRNALPPAHNGMPPSTGAPPPPPHGYYPNHQHHPGMVRPIAMGPPPPHGAGPIPVGMAPQYRPHYIQQHPPPQPGPYMRPMYTHGGPPPPPPHHAYGPPPPAGYSIPPPQRPQGPPGPVPMWMRPPPPHMQHMQHMQPQQGFVDSASQRHSIAESVASTSSTTSSTGSAAVGGGGKQDDSKSLPSPAPDSAADDSKSDVMVKRPDSPHSVRSHKSIQSINTTASTSQHDGRRNSGGATPTTPVSAPSTTTTGVATTTAPAPAPGSYHPMMQPQGYPPNGYPPHMAGPPPPGHVGPMGPPHMSMGPHGPHPPPHAMGMRPMMMGPPPPQHMMGGPRPMALPPHMIVQRPPAHHIIQPQQPPQQLPQQQQQQQQLARNDSDNVSIRSTVSVSTVKNGGGGGSGGSANSSMNLAFAGEDLETARQNAKRSNDPAVQLAFAKFLIMTAEGAIYQDPNPKQAKKTQDLLYQESLKWIKKLSTQAGVGKPAYPEAQFFLAECYGLGQLGLSVDHDKAFNLYVQASKQSHPAATYRTAVCYEVGAGTKRDSQRAVQFYRKAAALGDTAAMYKLGMILLNGLLGQGRNGREGVNWLKRAAQQADEGTPHALHELGLLYEGKGVETNGSILPDPAYSHDLFLRAAQLGYAPSQYKLGLCYEYGLLSLPIDPRRSIAWYTRAAEQGDPESELALSGWYLTGADGVLRQSDTEAYLWARKAADKGLAKAEYAVGYYTENG